MPDTTTDGLIREVADYYSKKLAEHGMTPLGVDWNGEASQSLRFQQLCRVIDFTCPLSLNDLGCGYGALLDYLLGITPDIAYYGCDVSQDMITAARIRLSGNDHATFSVASEPAAMADYGIASGIFNVRQARTDSEWLDYLKLTLDVLDRTSRKGFAFNCLTKYSDIDRMRPNLYYADPCLLFDYCKQHYSKHVALLHDYGLYEFTILVNKSL